MKTFSDLRTINESNQDNQGSFISEEIADITESLDRIASRIRDEEIANRLAEIAEELATYNKYFTIAEDIIAREDEYSMIPAIAESFRTGDSFEYTYADGETVEVNPDIAELAIDIYDNLDEENRALFAAMISESADSFEEVLNHFAEDLDLDESRLAGQRADERKPEKVDDTPEDNLGPKQGLKIAKDRKAYMARKAQEAEARRKAAGGLGSKLKKEEVETDDEPVSEKAFDKTDRPSKKNGPTHRDLTATATWMRKNKIEAKASAKDKKGSK